LRILVTGATGFVGRWAAKALTMRGAEVFSLSRAASQPGASGHAIAADLLDHASIRQVVNDIRPNTVLHLAWDVSHGRFYQAPANLDWLAASIHLARAAVDAGASRIVGVGTCVEYAPPEEHDCDEHTTLVEPTTLYGISKDAARRAISGYASEIGFSFAWARLFHMFGPFEDPRRLVPSVSVQLACGLPAALSSGRALRDFMDVRDVGEALAMLTLSDVAGAVNIGSGRAVSVGEIADHLADIAGRGGLIRRGDLPDRPDEAPRIVAATRRLNAEVGYPPPRPLRENLADAYDWWLNRAKSVA
jgi:nucleoside-diphosphate-sugar epimerase